MEETRRLLRAAERGALPGTTGGVRDRAIVTVLLFTALHIAELAGHARLETTRRYSLPSDADRQAAMDALTADY